MSVVTFRCDFLEQLPEEEKEAFENIFPCTKYPSHQKVMITLEQWNSIKLDYEEKIKDYYGFIKPQNDPDSDYEPRINYLEFTKHCPRILYPLQLEIKHDKEPKIKNLLQVALENKPDIQVYDIHSFLDLEDILMRCYPCGNCEPTNSEINIENLSNDLTSGKTYYKISPNVYSQICDFKFMTEFLSRPQKESDSDASVPYNKCLAIFMIFYYMRCNYLCTEFIKNMETIMGNFHGLLDMRELMLKLHFPVSITQEELTPNHYLAQLADGFPTLVDMKLSYYKFFVWETGHKITLCFSQSKSFYMNKITYSTFAEHFENMTVKKLQRYYQFRLSMLYTFKLLVPDQENFELAKTVGFIDSHRIDWYFWKENVIRYPFFVRQPETEFLVKRQYETLLKMKSRYYNFFLNLFTDYRRSLVHDPVSLVFNIAAVVFAMTGVIGVLQNAGIIPSFR